MTPATAAATLPCWACGAEAERVEHFLPGTIYRCAGCGLLFRGASTSGDVRDLYDERYFETYGGEGYADEGGRREYEAKRRLGFVGGRRPRGALLEVGTAEGHFLRAARDAGYDVRGIEPAESAARAATARSGVDVEVGFVEDADLPPRAFDAVCAWHVLEHIPEPHAALEHVRESLRDDGLLFLEVPNGESVAARRMERDWPHWQAEHHVAHYGPRSLRSLLRRAGYEPLAIDTFPVTAYYPPRIALAPGQLYSYVREGLSLRAIPRRPHPWKHELLRAVARRAA